jgi:hypothetical protein
MKIDTFFTKGTSHRICEDYATHGDDFLVICDGCSAQLNTDIGARLLARAAIQNLKEEGEIACEQLHQRILSTALGYCQSLGLSYDCLYATLLLAQLKPEGLMFQMLGDGAIAVQFEDGSIDLMEASFPFSAPFYLIYRKNLEMVKDYLDKINQFKVKTTKVDAEGNITTQEDIHSISLDNVEAGIEQPSYSEKPKIKNIAVFSDGLGTFFTQQTTKTTKSPEPISSIDVVKELFKIKNYMGEFVTRRTNMAMKKNGWLSSDDFSVGMIHFEPGE